METIAVYWEPIVRIYGYDIKSDISLLHIKCSLENADEILGDLEPNTENSLSFIFTQLQLQSPDIAHIHLAAEHDRILSYRNTLESNTDYSKIMVTAYAPVDLLFFHGPHFQDRYGIASNVFKTLTPASITVHTVGCTGTSVFIVTDGGQAATAWDILTEAFSLPL